MMQYGRDRVPWLMLFLLLFAAIVWQTGLDMRRYLRTMASNVNVVLRRYNREVATDLGQRVLLGAFHSECRNETRSNRDCC